MQMKFSPDPLKIINFHMRHVGLALNALWLPLMLSAKYQHHSCQPKPRFRKVQRYSVYKSSNAVEEKLMIVKICFRLCVCDVMCMYLFDVKFDIKFWCCQAQVNS